MAYYRLYFLDGTSGHILRVQDFEADTDESACERAEGSRGPAPMELWSKSRKIRSWESQVLDDHS